MKNLAFFILFAFSFAYAEGEGILKLFKNELNTLNSFLNQFKNPQKIYIPLKSENETNYLKSFRKLLLEEGSSRRKLMFLDFGADYNSEPIIADDRYPFTFRAYFGLRFPILKDGLLEGSYAKKLNQKLSVLNSLRVVYPAKNLSILNEGVLRINKYNQNVLNDSLKNFLISLSKKLKPIAQYDKYYTYTINLINEINEEIEKDILFEGKKLKVYSFCIVDELSINSFLKKREKLLKKTIKDTNLQQVNYTLINSKMDLSVRYYYRENTDTNFNNDYLSFMLTLSIPVFSDTESLQNIDKLKLLQYKKQAIYDFYTLKANLKKELLNQLQAYYNYKNHLIELQITISAIKREIQKVELGVEKLNIEKLLNLTRKAYNQLNLVNLYYQRLLLSYERIKSIMKSIDKNAKILCKTGS